MKSLDNFAALEITSAEEVKGGTFKLLSFLFGFKKKYSAPAPAPAPAPHYVAPKPSHHTGGYNAPVNNCCVPKPRC
ncbi:MAG: hypothetical protein U5N85_20925 [Arcicella sp.]|nr:hypothetical protein [Arcicella sp.]